MDKHTQPRITHRASRLGDMRIACLCTRAKPVSRVAYIHARTRSRNAHERSLFTAPTTETIDHHPRSTSTISDMVANICRAKHTNTIQYCLPTASGAQPFWSMLRYRQVPFVIAALSVSHSPVRILTLPWTCVMLHHADGTSVSNGKRAFHYESIEPLPHKLVRLVVCHVSSPNHLQFSKIKIIFNIDCFMSSFLFDIDINRNKVWNMISTWVRFWENKLEHR